MKVACGALFSPWESLVKLCTVQGRANRSARTTSVTMVHPQKELPGRRVVCKLFLRRTKTHTWRNKFWQSSTCASPLIHVVLSVQEAKKAAKKESRKEAEPKKAEEARIDMLDIRSASQSHTPTSMASTANGRASSRIHPNRHMQGLLGFDWWANVGSCTHKVGSRHARGTEQLRRVQE